MTSSAKLLHSFMKRTYKTKPMDMQFYGAYRATEKKKRARNKLTVRLLWKVNDGKMTNLTRDSRSDLDQHISAAGITNPSRLVPHGHCHYR